MSYEYEQQLAEELTKVEAHNKALIEVNELLREMNAFLKQLALNHGWLKEKYNETICDE